MLAKYVAPEYLHDYLESKVKSTKSLHLLGQKVRLRLIWVGGAAVILTLGWLPRQAGGISALKIRPPRASLADAQRVGGGPLRAEILQDTTRVRQDTTRVRQDTTRLRQDTTRLRQDTTRVGEPLAADTASRSPADQDTTPAGIAAPGDTAGDPQATRDLAIGLKRMPLPYRVELVSRLPDPTRQRPELRERVGDWSDSWASELRERSSGWRAELWRVNRPLAVTSRVMRPAADTVTQVAAPVEQPEVEEGDEELLAPPPGQREPTEPQILPDVLDEYADLGLAVQGRVELGGGWNRFRPCDITLQFNCDPGLIPAIKPDIQFGARVGGTISERIHVNVDYDNRREFDAANNINVFYQGLEDEILQRVEVGDVSFPLPQSRYLTQGIPAGNFGFRATGQMGPIDFQTVWAQQKGDLGTRELQVGGGGQGFEQTATTILDDADYERGRFFFLFDPRRLPAYPHVDIQELVAFDAPVELRPSSVVKVYRYEVLGVGAGAQVPEGFITAIAVATDTFTTVLGVDTVAVDTLTGLFRPLVNGEDYILHQSGVWLQLRNTLSDAEGLAIAYIADDGTEIGTFAAEAASDAHNADPDNVPPPRLELIKAVNHRPGTATWRREMHHIYRVSASPGVVETSIELTISQGDPEVGNTFRTTPSGTQLEFLKIFGLDDDPTDNRLDVSQIYTINASGSEGTAGPMGTYIIPPTLEPFRTPPPLRDVSDPLNGQPFPLGPGDQNTTIYDESNDQVRRGSNLYLLTVSYRQQFEGFLSSISLGAGGVREGSERLLIDNVELLRGEDYTIDYDIGQIELREPERWFQDNPSARIRVTFEQKPLFQLAPTGVFGFQARYGLGERGEINLIGLSQSEKTLQTRPELGLEPSAVQLGGVSGRLNFRPSWLNSVVGVLPGVEAEAPSALSFDGEIAVSMPNTNTQGVTFVEDFEGGPGFTVSLLQRGWRLGSAPVTNAGAEAIAPITFDQTTAGELVWQDQAVTSAGILGRLEPGQIDQELLIQGRTAGEPVLYLTTRTAANRRIAPNPNPAPGPSWASMTGVISANGQDFTTIEFLEFYVAVNDELADSTQLIIDMGTVSEDAFALDSLGQPSGIGRLNREADPPRVWTSADDIGLWSSGCAAEQLQLLYNLGDVAANCTRNNGLEDSEDLNQNNVLDSEERFFRYTVRIGDPLSPYFVRDARELGGARFRLFRVPLRRPDHRERVTDAEFQNIRHLRFTLVTSSNNSLIMARLRFLGSRWLKRGGNGVVVGLTDTTSVIGGGGLVEVGPISTLDPRYTPPPGVTDQAASQTDQFSLGGVTINEQSLSLSFSDLGADERAEVYLQYVQTPRDFLPYRSLQIWALGAEGSWGTAGQPLRFLFKLGENAGNYYLFRTRLPEVPPGATGSELRQAWLPELEIDFDRFIALRSKAEEIMLMEGGVPADSVLQVWDVDVFPDADSSYAVVISQRSRAPNLAAIRQISLGVYNAGSASNLAGEVWIDDLRLAVPVDNLGVVSQVRMDLRASDFLDFNVSYASENPYFRQLADEPSFQSSDQFRIGGRMQLGQLLPNAWGIRMPLAVDYSDNGTKPLLLPRTDIQAERLPGLRSPGSQNLRMDLSLSKQSAAPTPFLGWFVDNSSLRLSYDDRSSRTSRSLTQSQGFSAGYSFRDNIGDVSLPFFPGFLKKVFFFLPGGIKDSRLRLTPTAFQFNATYLDNEAETRRFQEIIELPGDTAVVPVLTLDERIQTNATLNLEPIRSLTGRFSLSQGRELVPTEELVQSPRARDLINGERSSLFGLDWGWETSRSMNVNWTYRPSLANWLTPQATLDTRYRFNRGASFITGATGDTVLTSDFSNSRTLGLSTGFNTPAFLRALFGQDRGGLLGSILALVDRIDIVTATWVGSLGSNYQRQTSRPSLRYQLAVHGFGGIVAQDGDTASRVNDGETFTLSGGFQLPLGLGLTMEYSNNDALIWTPITQTLNNTRTWPSVNLNWNTVPLPSFLRRWVSRAGVRTGYSLRNTSSIVPGANQDRLGETRTIPFSFDFALTSDWSLNYNLSKTDEERIDPTGLSQGERLNQSVQINGRVRPLSRQGNFKNPIRVSLRVSQNDQKQCRQLGGALLEEPGDGGVATEASCEPFSDLRIRNIDVTVGTDVPPFAIGLQGSWRDTQSGLGQRPGSTQLEISLFGQFLFESGEIR